MPGENRQSILFNRDHEHSVIVFLYIPYTEGLSRTVRETKVESMAIFQQNSNGVSPGGDSPQT